MRTLLLQVAMKEERASASRTSCCGRRRVYRDASQPRHRPNGQERKKHKKSANDNIHRQPKATTEPTVATETPEPPAAPDNSPEVLAPHRALLAVRLFLFVLADRAPCQPSNVIVTSVSF